MTIPEIKNAADQTIVNDIQIRVDKTYDRNNVPGGKGGPTTVQNVELSDTTGNKIRASVWGHPDLKDQEGKTLILHSVNGKFGLNGVKVKHGSYVAKKDGPRHKAGDTVKTVELEVSKAGQFQYVVVYRGGQAANSPEKAVPSPSGEVSAPTHTKVVTQGQTPSNGLKPVFGATVGMAINQAVAVLIHTEDINPKTFEDDLARIASQIIRVAQRLETGDLVTPENPF